MDDALALFYFLIIANVLIVLILVVMDDALAPYKASNAAIVTCSLNPCCNG